MTTTKPNLSGASPAKSEKSAEHVPTTFGPCRIIVADDEHLVATGIAAMVTELGHIVLGIAADGEAAVALAKQHNPDLALLDIRMPKVTGIDAARALKQELGIPSVIISAYSDQEHVKKIQSFGELSGVYGYLLKPVSKEELLVTLGVAVHRIAQDKAHNHRIDQLENNLANRRTVEQAKWILVQKRGWTEPQSHEKMQKTARDKRKQLIDVALMVIEKGDLID
jgi:response regulator NasT